MILVSWNVGTVYIYIYIYGEFRETLVKDGLWKKIGCIMEIKLLYMFLIFQIFVCGFGETTWF